MIADNQSGKYVNVEDVAIYIENNDSSGNALVHFDFADINVGDEDNTKTTSTDNTVAKDTQLPQTGVTYVIIAVIFVIAIFGIIFYIKYKKYKDIK
jgi:LPXTG-motif cell wall-anchored protein